MIDFFSTERHYADHLLPLWDRLDDNERGVWYTGGGGEPLIERLWAKGAVGTFAPIDPPDDTLPTLVASHTDYRYTPRNRPVIYLEHGAGQTYLGVEHGGYSGGEGRERVILFLCPNDRVVGLNRARYPDIPAIAVGCPRLDKWVDKTVGEYAGKYAERPTVAFSCHWDCDIAPETKTGFWEFSPALPALMERYDVLGHGHPKALESFRGTYNMLGIEVVEDFDDVLARADCYIVDNSSTAFEWCAVADRPIVMLHPSFYRSDVCHGLRFYDAAPLPWCPNPYLLLETVERALRDCPDYAAMRRSAAHAAYGDLADGHATDRAIEAIRSLT